MSKEQYLECAVVSGTHGVRGMVKLQNYTDSPDVLASVKTLYTKEKSGEYRFYKVLKSSIHKKSVIALLEGIESLDEAILLKGKTLYAERDSFRLKKGDFFIVDLIGLPVIDFQSGEKYGKVSDVMTGRVQNIYVVSKENGESFMIPGVNEFIKDIKADGDDAGIYVKLIEGMTDQ